MASKKQYSNCFLNRKVVIIGATGGLGKAYTDMFLREGAHVYLGIRSMKRFLEQYQDKDERIKTGLIDIQVPESVESFANIVKDDWGHVDYVINATGYDVRKDLVHHSIEEIQKSININLTGAIYITKYFLGLLKEQEESSIVHMGGFVDGGLAFPYYSADVAARSGVFSFCESMNRELRQENHRYHITYFCPNPANTQAELPFHPVWKEMKTKISKVEDVAESLKRALIKRKKVYIMGGEAENGFSKLNHVSIMLSDWLLMNKYSRILKKYFGSDLNESGENLVDKKDCRKKNKSTFIAAGLILFSFVIYLGLGIFPCLEIRKEYKLLLFVIINILSWGSFIIGSMLGGKELLKKMHKK